MRELEWWKIRISRPLMFCIYIGYEVDKCCWLFQQATVSLVFTSYVELVALISRQLMTPGLSHANIHQLNWLIASFKGKVLHANSKYQQGRFESLKWHAPDHLVQELDVVCGTKYLHSWLYESSHKMVKDSDRSILKDRLTAIEKRWTVKCTAAPAEVTRQR